MYKYNIHENGCTTIQILTTHAPTIQITTAQIPITQIPTTQIPGYMTIKIYDNSNSYEFFKGLYLKI